MHGTSSLARRFAALASLGFEPAARQLVDRDLLSVGRRATRVVHRRPAMGTLVSVSAVVRSPDHADEAVGRAQEEMDRLVGIFSHHDDCSAASELNLSGRIDRPPPELVEVMARARYSWHMTGGGFDISVAPVVELFRSCRAGALPDRGEVRAALELVGAEKIDVSRRRIGFRRRGMRVTLDGIAKGFIVDAMAGVLERRGIRNYLVEAGGDIRARGSRGRGRPWRVAVEDPDKGPAFAAAIELCRGAVATSGSYEEFYDPDREHHHIVDADTGRSPRQTTSATVIAPSAMAADAMATSVLLMPPRAGVELIDGLRGCECLIIAASGEQTRSRGWREAGRT